MRVLEIGDYSRQDAKTPREWQDGRRQVSLPVVYGGLKFDEGFRVDLIIENRVIVELKCVEKLNNAHKKQLLTYLRLADKKLGYLLNFGEALMKHGMVRIVNRLSEPSD